MTNARRSRRYARPQPTKAGPIHRPVANRRPFQMNLVQSFIRFASTCPFGFLEAQLNFVASTCDLRLATAAAAAGGFDGCSNNLRARETIESYWVENCVYTTSKDTRLVR